MKWVEPVARTSQVQAGQYHKQVLLAEWQEVWKTPTFTFPRVVADTGPAGAPRPITIRSEVIGAGPSSNLQFPPNGRLHHFYPFSNELLLFLSPKSMKILRRFS